MTAHFSEELDSLCSDSLSLSSPLEPEDCAEETRFFQASDPTPSTMRGGGRLDFQGESLIESSGENGGVPIDIISGVEAKDRLSVNGVGENGSGSNVGV